MGVGEFHIEKGIEMGLDFLGRFLPIVNTQLGKSKYIAGDVITVADFCLLAEMDPSELVELNIADYGNIHAWREELRAQDFYQKVLIRSDERKFENQVKMNLVCHYYHIP